MDLHEQQQLLDSYGPGQLKSDISVPNASSVISENIKAASNASNDLSGGPLYANGQLNNNNLNMGGSGNNEHQQRDKFEFNSNQLKDKLNITNSLIISNSQILFQDIGNGKIIPIPFPQAMGTI